MERVFLWKLPLTVTFRFNGAMTFQSWKGGADLTMVAAMGASMGP